MDQQLGNYVTRFETAVSQLEAKVKLESLVNRFETALKKLENVELPQAQTTQNNQKPAQSQKKEAEIESNMVCLKTFEETVDKFVNFSKKLQPELQTISTLVKQISQCMVHVYLTSEHMKKPTVDQLKTIQPIFLAIANKIRDFDRNPDLQPFAKTMYDIVVANYWVFSDELPYKHIQGQVESGEFYGLKILQKKNPELTEWYKTIIDAYKGLHDIVKKEYPTGLTWNAKGETSTYEKLVQVLKSVESGNSAETGKQQEPVKIQEVPKQQQQTQQVQVAKPAEKPKNAPKMEKAKNGWMIEHYGKETLTIAADQLSMKDPVFIDSCQDTNIVVQGKCKFIALQKCKNCKVLFEGVVTIFEIINSEKITVQCNQTCPSITADNSEQIKVYFTKGYENCKIYTQSVGEFNVTKMEPEKEDWSKDYMIPARFETAYDEESKSFKTIVCEQR